MRHRFIAPGALLALAAVCGAAPSASAKPARCMTTDDGRYPCEFRATDRRGSFQVSAPGKPTFILNVTEPGVADGFMSLGGRTIALPGRYLRDPGDPACWIGEATQARICAY